MQSFVALSKAILSIVSNLAQEEKCHTALVQNNIPEAVFPFCFNSSIQVRWESKCFLAILHKLTGSWYYSFLRLSADEIRLVQLCFQNAAISDDHHVILKLGESSVRYSAFELALGITGLSHHHLNRAAFADPKILAATFNLLVTGSLEEKVVSIQLMTKLVDDPELCSVVLKEHPDMPQYLLSLSKDDKVGNSLQQDASKLLKTLVDVKFQGSRELNSFATTVDAQVLQWKIELDRLLTWAIKEMNKSKVLHNAANNDTVEGVMSVVFVISHLCLMLHFKESHLAVQSALQDHPGFLLVLQDYIQRHFLSKFNQFNTSMFTIFLITMHMHAQSDVLRSFIESKLNETSDSESECLCLYLLPIFCHT